MRSSKSRSRSKQNRPRTLGNIINRVFDSSGPEGKVRGTPQQIIEKYQLLARDAQLSNDRVAAENFLQHAEHYTRLLAEAQREMLAEQEARQQYHQQNQSGNGHGNANGNGIVNGNRDRPAGDREYRNDRDQPREDYSDEQPYVSATAAFEVMGEEDAGLVELPEFARPPRREYSQDRPRDDRPRDDRPREDRARTDRPRDDRPRDDRPRDDRPRDERPRDERPRDDRPRTDNNRPKQNQDRPREDRRPETRPEPRFVEQPVVAAPAAVVAADPAPVVVEQAAPVKPAPKPRVRKVVAKVETPQGE